MFIKNLVKGFTLIELLVVIAIVGVLSSVVMGSVNSAREKSINAAIKLNMGTIRNQAEIVGNENNMDYTTVCVDPKIVDVIEKSILLAGDLVGTALTRCYSETEAWAVNVLLKVPENDGANLYWCVDSSGSSRPEPVELAEDETVCA